LHVTVENGGYPVDTTAIRGQAGGADEGCNDRALDVPNAQVNNVYHLHRCQRCGRPGLLRCATTADGTEAYDYKSCETCELIAESQIARVRVVYDALLVAEVPVDVANDVMDYLLARLYDT
jgi:hypothetical protein